MSNNKPEVCIRQALISLDTTHKVPEFIASRVLWAFFQIECKKLKSEDFWTCGESQTAMILKVLYRFLIFTLFCGNIKVNSGSNHGYFNVQHFFFSFCDIISQNIHLLCNKQ